MSLATEKEIAAKLKSLRGWKRNGTGIVRTFNKKDFVRAMGFVQSVAFLAERVNHHPDITIRWNKVTLVLSTHSESGLTTRDFELAENINNIH
jgi:4a-hydroxytetrahydrobiopterin dehydratase